jgi:hypothetical protein
MRSEEEIRAEIERIDRAAQDPGYGQAKGRIRGADLATRETLLWVLGERRNTPAD